MSEWLGAKASHYGPKVKSMVVKGNSNQIIATPSAGVEWQAAYVAGPEVNRVKNWTRWSNLRQNRRMGAAKQPRSMTEADRIMSVKWVRRGVEQSRNARRKGRDGSQTQLR